MNSPALSAPVSVRIQMDPGLTGPRIHRNIYGHFAEHLGRCIYEGVWVGEDSAIPHLRGIRQDAVEALRRLQVPVLRWPGGCFADEYNWKDGIGPREHRPAMINTHWGEVVENNHFGTHEFMDLCEQLGAAPYICGNVGSGTPRELMEWVEYMTSDARSPMANLRRSNGREKPWKLPYLGVGNESWGCGGNMLPEYYADNYRRFNTFVKNYGGGRIERIACGANGANYRWTEVLMEKAAGLMDGLSLHYYTIPTGDWHQKGSATGFVESDWYSTIARTLVMDSLIQRHAAIMDAHDPEKRIGMVIDEWGTWCDVEPGTNPGFLYQQNSLRDAIVAALNFHIFHRYADRVSMTNIAQTINVLQAVLLTDREKLILTPTYHVFEMFRPHQDAFNLPLLVQTPVRTVPEGRIPMVSASASLHPANGVITLSLVNTEVETNALLEVQTHWPDARLMNARILTAATIDAHNTFYQPEQVCPVEWEDVHILDGVIRGSLPPRAVGVLSLVQS